MPNHTMFPKYSKRKEIRVQSCHGFVSAVQRERVTFLFPLASWRQQCSKGNWLFGCFSLDGPRDSLSLCVCVVAEGRRSLGRDEVCANHL